MISSSRIDPKKTRRNLILACFILMICSFSTQRLLAHSSVRTVEAVSLIALGIAIGGLIFNLVLHFGAKKAQNMKM